MNATDRLTRIYAAWLLIYSEAPAQVAEHDQFDECVGLLLDMLLEDTGVDSWMIAPKWGDTLIALNKDKQICN